MSRRRPTRKGRSSSVVKTVMPDVCVFDAEKRKLELLLLASGATHHRRFLDELDRLDEARRGWK